MTTISITDISIVISFIRFHFLTDTIGFTGTLEAGKEGDFIAVKGKPDQNISDIRNLEMVAKGCRLVWSSVPGMMLRRYGTVPSGMNIGGGTYLKW